MRPTLLTRGGREEATDDLSKGTQEQLAVLTRIAFADLLIEKGKPASLMLDDALVFADDDRFEVMLDILTEAAQRMQIIILSCRTSRSEEHTSELQSLMRISYAVFCLKKKKN